MLTIEGQLNYTNFKYNRIFFILNIAEDCKDLPLN